MNPSAVGVSPPSVYNRPAMKIPLNDIYSTRTWEWDDAPSLTKYADNPNIWMNLRDAFPHPYRHTDARAWIRGAKEQKPETQFAIANLSEAIGGIGLTVQNDVYRLSAEMGYWLAEPFWGKGIATMAVRAFTQYAFSSYGLVRVFATVFEWNKASARVLEKAGFTLEARLRKNVIKNGQIIDTLLYAKLKEDP